MSLNYLNIVKESMNTVRLANTLVILVGGFITKLMCNKEGMLLGLSKIMSIAGVLVVAEGIGRWSKEMLVEGRKLGKYTKKVLTGLTYSTVLFIGSELFLFLSLIGTAHDGFANQKMDISQSSIEISSTVLWFGEGIGATAILLLSSITFNIYKALYDSYDVSEYNTLNAVSTQLLGMSFMLFQLEEYTRAAVSIFTANSTAGFFIVTGFHGLHVAIGWLMLAGQIALATSEMRSTTNIGLFYSLIYWHFVDAVWFGVVFLIYYHHSMPISSIPQL